MTGESMRPDPQSWCFRGVLQVVLRRGIVDVAVRAVLARHGDALRTPAWHKTRGGILCWRCLMAIIVFSSWVGSSIPLCVSNSEMPESRATRSLSRARWVQGRAWSAGGS